VKVDLYNRHVTVRMGTICARRRSPAAIFTAQSDLGEPFGMTTDALPEGPLWGDVAQSAIAEGGGVVFQCRVQPRACPSFEAQKFIDIADEGRFYTDDGDRHGDLGRIGRINRAVNLSISAIKTGTEWTSPLTALAAGVGDFASNIPC